MLTKNAFEYGLSKSEYLRKLILAESLSGKQWHMDRDQAKQLISCSNKREKPLQAKLDYFFFYCSIKKPKTLENKGFRRYYLARQKGFEPPAFPLGATLFGLCLVVRRASKCPQTRINTGFFVELPVAEYLKISSNIGPFCTQIEPAIRQIVDRF